MKLTENETVALRALVRESMDDTGSETVDEYRGEGGFFITTESLEKLFKNPKSRSGMFSTLMKKGLLELYEKRKPPMLDLYVVTDLALDWYKENFGN